MHTNTRCAWAGSDPEMIMYHDTEWGVPVHDDQKLFEFLILEGAQAGLSWSTILHKRDAYRKAFKNFNPPLVARYTEADIQRLCANPGIVRNQLKIRGAVQNARAFLAVQKEFGSFTAYVWEFVGNKTAVHTIKNPKDIPTNTKESVHMSRDMKKRGFTFVGPTICYAFMQAVGMVDDHEASCFRKKVTGVH